MVTRELEAKMSCHETNGGLLSLRLARAFSGLEENRLQVLYHELKREGSNMPLPTEEQFSRWKARQLVLIENAPISLLQKSRSETDLFLATYEDYDAATFYAWKRLEVRARQEAVLNSIQPPLREISLPGSQADYYDLDENGRPKRIWYASYGSNLSKARFMSYVNGTVPEGLQTSHPGCRDSSDPTGDIAISFPGRMHFAGKSSRWGGGGASFVDGSSVGKALGRAYNLSIEQFDDIVAQENRQEVGSLIINTKELLEKKKTSVSETLPYGTLIHVGDYAGNPIFTLTSDFTSKDSIEHSAAKEVEGSDISTRTPNHNYLRTIGLGLKEAFNMDVKAQADYLRGAPGAEDIIRTEMIKILNAPVETRQARNARLTIENNLEIESIAKGRASLASIIELAYTITPKLEAEIKRREAILDLREEWVTEKVKKIQDQEKARQEKMGIKDSPITQPEVTNTFLPLFSSPESSSKAYDPGDLIGETFDSTLFDQ